ncbi:MAG: TraR/DksA family transcriptional regulator [Magnetospiraceae bacterium]
MSTLQKNQEDTVRERLEALRTEVTSLNEGHAHDSDTVEVDSAMGRLSRMDALQQQAMAAEQARRRDVELHRIDSALQRLEEGDYGYCTVCGEEIAKKRLAFDPTATTCIKCARAGEH